MAIVSHTWGPHDKTLNEENVALTPEPYFSVSASVFNYSSNRRSELQVQVGCSQLSPPQNQAQQMAASLLLYIKLGHYLIMDSPSQHINSFLGFT